MDYTFNSDIASVYGVNEAIFIHNLYWWISKNKANERHFYEGKYWTYNTTKAFSELFPFWSERQVNRIIKKLMDEEVLYVGNFNQSTYDRTRWYALDDKIYSIYQNGNMHVTERSNASDQTVESKLPNGQMEVTERSNPFDQTVTTIPDSKPDSKPNSKPDGDKDVPLPAASPRIDYEAYRKAFIFSCPSLPGLQDVKEWTKARKKAIRDKRMTPEEMAAVFERVERSDFLSGRKTGEGWCSLDWVLKPKNWQKINEGNYDNRPNCKPPSGGGYSPSYDIEAYERSSIFDE